MLAFYCDLISQYHTESGSLSKFCLICPVSVALPKLMEVQLEKELLWQRLHLQCANCWKVHSDIILGVGIQNGRFIFGERNGIHILDLQQTMPLFGRALEAMRDTVAKGGRILFVGTKRAAADRIAEQPPAVNIT